MKPPAAHTVRRATEQRIAASGAGISASLEQVATEASAGAKPWSPNSGFRDASSEAASHSSWVAQKVKVSPVLVEEVAELAAAILLYDAFTGVTIGVRARRLRSGLSLHKEHRLRCILRPCRVVASGGLRSLSA